MLFSQIAFAESAKECVTVTYTDQDVTGDGIKEQIYISLITYSPGKYQTFLNVMQETAQGKINIFPKVTPNRTYFDNNVKINLSMPTALSRGSKVVIDKFDSYKGKQILIYYICGARDYAYGDFYKFDHKTNMFELYRHDITDKKYKNVGSGKNPPDNTDKIIKEFKRKTNFNRAYEVAVKFWNAIKNKKWETAYSLCEPEVKDTVKSWEDYFDDQNIQNSLSINLMIWDGKFDEKKQTYNFSGANNKMWQSIGVNKNLKIEWFMGEGLDVGI
jgi:hypothetical protein